MSQTESITTLVLCSISWLFALCLIFYQYKFYKLRHEMITIKRRGSIVVAYTMCAIVILLLGYPLNILRHWHILPESNFLNIMEDILFNPFYYFYLMFVLSRYWLMYYDIQFSHSCSNLEWKQLISPNSAALSNEKWFISCHSTLGNQAYILKRAVITATIISILSLTTVFLWEFNVISLALWYVINGIVGPVVLSAMLYLTIKMPRVEDSIHLYKEAKIISICFITCYCVYLLSVFIQITLYEQNSILDIFIRFAGMMAAFIVPFISTCWVLQQLQQPPDVISAQLSAQDWLLSDILEKEGVLELFIQHLMNEFCVENIIGLIECVQFKEHLIETFDINKKDAGRDFDDIVFPQSVPASCIVYSSLGNMVDDDQDSDDFKEQKLNQCKKAAYQLYKKYFEMGAEYEVNICLSSKKELSEFMDYRFMDGYETWISVDSVEFSEELQSLVTVFDDPMMEMVSLLRRSKQTFELTQEQLRPIVTC